MSDTEPALVNKRDALEISASIEAVGGDLNAWTEFSGLAGQRMPCRSGSSAGWKARRAN